MDNDRIIPVSERVANYTRPMSQKTGTERGPARQDAVCTFCGKHIPKGTMCESDLVHVCMDCVERLDAGTL